MFGGLRLLTWAIHVHVHGLGNVSAGGVHLHHYLYGILLVIGVAVCGLVERSPRWHAWMGLAFGIGLALIIDEAAELIELKDVYWSGQGGVSVAIALTVIGVAGSTLAVTHSHAKKTDNNADQSSSR
jgi:TctA family transporter